MNNRLTLFTFIIATLLAGCASTPTRLDELNTENTGLTSDIKLNGVLISHGNKFVLDNAFRIPKAPWDYSISFTDVPTGPWEFYGYSFFPKFDSSSITCADSDCDQFNQLKGPFINFECKAARSYDPGPSIRYWGKTNEIEREKTEVEHDYIYEYDPIYTDREGNKLDPEKIEVEDGLTIGDIIIGIPVGVVAIGAFGALAITNAPGVIIESGLNKLGICTDSERRIWFDYDEYFDTVKKTILNDYGSINAYVTDIRQASMAYKTLSNIDNNKRVEVESLIREWDVSIDKLLPENDSMDNYRIRYSPYALVKIPRKEDWSRKCAVIESDILSHYAKQLTSINRQMYSYNKLLKQRYGIVINLSTEVK